MSIKSQISPHNHSEPREFSIRKLSKGEQSAPLRLDSLPLSSIDARNNAPRDRDMFVNSPTSTEVRKQMPAYPTQIKAVELK